MADPTAVRDDRGEWLRLRNTTNAAIPLRGWRLASGGDAGVVIRSALVVPARGTILIARDARRSVNGGLAVAWGWGRGLTLGNGADWVALRDARGVTVDSVAWRTTRPGISWAPHVPTPRAPVATAPIPAGEAGSDSALVVRILDVGQGDATLIANGGSTVLVDGGPDQDRLGVLLDSLALNGTTIDVVVLSHQ
ncbi:MAG TPA: lamin tail domain-containing protein, partial [Gemmatimonadaceae bacterium]|nr:lamin tail domain-containing protein [Gemmatimonadaceae bacterium]